MKEVLTERYHTSFVEQILRTVEEFEEKTTLELSNDDVEIKQAIEILEIHNKWRRGDDTIPMTNPTELGIAIDVIVTYLKKMKN